MTPHQVDMVQALRKVPDDTEFTAGDMRKIYGYPHADASKVLQQYAIVGVFVGYFGEAYRAGKIRYRRSDDFEIHRTMSAIRHPEIAQ